MNHILLFLCIWIGAYSLGMAQGVQLRTPYYIDLKYTQDSTRDKSGKPGVNYWQNHAKYDITVKYVPEDFSIEGEETITYTNNSPQTLDKIVFQVYEDVRKKGSPSYAPRAPIDVFDGVEIFDIQIDGTPIADNNINRNSTVLTIKLDETEHITPQSKKTVSLKWNYKLPWKERATGMIDSSSFFCSKWYPQIAVYDDLYGWDNSSWIGIGEFYNEVANYSVKIVTPKDYVIWATGDLKNPSEVFSKKLLGKYQTVKSSDQTVTLISEDQLPYENQTQNNDSLIWHFEAKNIGDFSFGCSKIYVWRAKQNKTSNTLIHVAHNATSKEFENATEVVNSTIDYFSKTLVDFPFSTYSVFEGNVATEFPMMALMKNEPNFNSYLTHEVLHSYIPFLVASNEKKHGWIDEGTITFRSMVLQDSLFTEENIGSVVLYYFNLIISRSHDVPLMQSTNECIGAKMVYNTYAKPLVSLATLEKMLGKDTLNLCIKKFIERWAYKHPIPYDFFYTFNDVSRKDLNWFWSKFYFEVSYPDVAIQMGEYSKQLIVTNVGGMPVGVKVDYHFENGNVETQEFPALVWEHSNKLNIPLKENLVDLKKIEVNPLIIKELRPSDNSITF